MLFGLLCVVLMEIFTLSPAQASGHYEDGVFMPDGVCADPRGCGDTSSPSSTPSGPTQEQLKQQRERLRLKGKEWSTDEAMDYYDRKDWDNAIRSFEEALDRDPDDPDLQAWLNRAKAEKAKSRMPARITTPRPAPTNDSTVVDARNVPSGLPKSVEMSIPHTPAGDRVRKGFQAITTHDWKVAAAWFQDALNHEPGSPGLQRLVDLAQFTLQRQSDSAAKAKDDASEAAMKKTGKARKSGISPEVAGPLNAFYRFRIRDVHKESAPRLYKWVNPDGSVVYMTKDDIDWLNAPEPGHAWKQFFRFFAPAYKVQQDGTVMYSGIRG